MNNYSGTDLALKAFESRPTRIEALSDLARWARDNGMNETAAMFSWRGLKIPPTNDLLFCETWGYEECKSTLSISGFYSVDPETRAAAARMCDELALDRNVSRETRDLARQNLEFYLRPIAEVFPSWHARRLTFSPPDGYNAMAPSVTQHGDHVLAAQRTVNYKVDARGYVRVADDLPLTGGAKIHTRTFLIDIDPDTLDSNLRGEILLPANLPAATYDVVTGFEDTRLFSWRGYLWGLSTVLDQNPEARAEQWLARLGADLRMEEARPIYPEGPIQPREKNWIPLIDGDDLRFIYRSDPTRIIDHEGRTVAESVPDIAADHLSGSSQAIPFAGGWLAVTHWRQWFDGWPKYRHRFAWYDAEYRLKKISPGWVFSTKQPELSLLAGYEYCTGLTYIDQQRLILGYQIHERESWVGTIDAGEVTAALGLPPLPNVASSCVAGRDAAQRGAEVRNIASRNAAARGVPQATLGSPPLESDCRSSSLFDDERWVLAQTNRALQDQAAVERATWMLNQARLPEHRDRIKNWDTVIALHHARKHCHLGAAILDAGGDRNAAFLPCLARLGYGRLLSLNLEERAPACEGGVAYSWGDITDTGLPDGSQGFVACLSVLEHGVDVSRFLREMARIIAPGGHLFISVDFWEVPVSTAHVIFQGSYAGQRWQIFTPASLDELVGHANPAGLQVVGDVDFRCRDRVAHHLGCSYTFLNLLLCR